MLLQICLCFCAICFKHVLSQAEDDCKIAASGAPGKCTNVLNCPAALVEIKSYKKPQLCYFDHSDPIVCCATNSTPALPKSEQMCVEYSKRPVQHIFATNNKHIKVAVVGGLRSLAKEFPHMAALGFGEESDKKWICGGALISDQHVMTAAHCRFSVEYGYVRWVRLGDLNLKSTTDTAAPQDFSVATVITHPDYKAPSSYNDIAIIRLDRPINFTDFVKPACLRRNPDYSNLNVTATGWGTTSFGGELSDDLLKVDLSTYSDQECQTEYPPERTIPTGIHSDTQFCAGGRNESKDTCQGDSGGPVQIKRTSPPLSFDILGITSFGRSCGAVNIPGVYTKVSYFVPWIESIVWP